MEPSVQTHCRIWDYQYIKPGINLSAIYLSVHCVFITSLASWIGQICRLCENLELESSAVFLTQAVEERDETCQEIIMAARLLLRSSADLVFERVVISCFRWPLPPLWQLRGFRRLPNAGLAGWCNILSRSRRRTRRGRCEVFSQTLFEDSVETVVGLIQTSGCTEMATKGIENIFIIHTTFGSV